MRHPKQLEVIKALVKYLPGGVTLRKFNNLTDAIVDVINDELVPKEEPAV